MNNSSRAEPVFGTLLGSSIYRVIDAGSAHPHGDHGLPYPQPVAEGVKQVPAMPQTHPKLVSSSSPTSSFYDASSSSPPAAPAHCAAGGHLSAGQTIGSPAPRQTPLKPRPVSAPPRRRYFLERSLSSNSSAVSIVLGASASPLGIVRPRFVTEPASFSSST